MNSHDGLFSFRTLYRHVRFLLPLTSLKCICRQRCDATSDFRVSDYVLPRRRKLEMSGARCVKFACLEEMTLIYLELSDRLVQIYF